MKKKKSLAALLFFGVCFSTPMLASGNSKFKADSNLIERGRYLIKVTGCNDCHTPGYILNEGTTPEESWLIGNNLGFRGPWGTTYPTNLRSRLAEMSEREWVVFAKSFKVRPPMPWFQVNAMSGKDLRAIYHFVRSLGDSENKVPEALPPTEAPRPPYVDFNPMMVKPD